MAVIPADILARYVDLMCAFYTRAVGTQASGYGFGTSGGAWGCAGSVQDLKGVLLNQDTNLDSVALLTPIMQTLEAGVFGAQVAKSYLAPMIGTLSNHVQLYGVASVTDLDSYMSFLNVSDTVKWQCLAPPTWRNLNTFFTPSAKNVYYEVQQGATFVNGLGKGVVTGAGACTYTDQANVGELVTYSSSTGSIDNTKYAGGFPYALVSGLTGTGIVTVTGHGYDAITQAVVTGTWTATVTGNGLWQLSNVTYPQAALLGVSGIAVAAGISAGTIYVEAWRPIWHSGTSTAGGASTITLATSALRIDDVYNGCVIGQAADNYTARTISDYDGATRVATVSSPWSVAPTATAYRIWRPQ